MDDELNSTDSTQTENHNPPEVDELEPSKASQARITQLEGLLAQKDEELSLADTRITELEQALAELDKKSTETSTTLSQAVASYKALIINTNPGVLAEMITGDTIDVVNESLENAQALTDRVRQGIEEEVSMTKVPAGAPQRTPLDFSALSPREKIQYAIGGKR